MVLGHLHPLLMAVSTHSQGDRCGQSLQVFILFLHWYLQTLPDGGPELPCPLSHRGPEGGN